MIHKHDRERSRFGMNSMRTVAQIRGFTLIELMAVVAVAAVAVTLTFSLGPSIIRQYRWSSMVRACYSTIEMARMRAIARGGGFVTLEFIPKYRTDQDENFYVAEINPAFQKGVSDQASPIKAYEEAKGRSDQLEFQFKRSEFDIQVDPPSYFPYRAKGAVLSFEGCGSSAPSQTLCWKTPCDCRTDVDGLVFGARGAQRDWVDRKIIVRAIRPGDDRTKDLKTEIRLNGMGTMAQGN